MNFLSLFSGIGGIDLGLQRAGMTIAGQVEIDPWCRKILAKHWPEVPRHDDVRTTSTWWGGRDAPDVVAGGFPCQPVSLAGKGLAQADSRWLWPATHSVIRDLRPRWVLLENVPGLLARGMGDVLGDLASIGYDAEWDCVPACFVGALHIRNRVWIVAYPQGRGCHPPRQDGSATTRPDTASWRSGQHARPMAYSQGDRRQAEGQRSQAGHPHRSRDLRHGRQANHAAHTASPERRGTQQQDLAARVWPSEPGECPRLSEPGTGWWAAEPDVGRVAHGIPGRLDRLRGLGNAVVPQVAEHIGRLILEAAHG